MAVLGIISLIILFILFFAQFGNWEEIFGDKTQVFDEDYYEFNMSHVEVEITLEQEKVYNYMYAQKYATAAMIDLSCEGKQSDIDELVYLGVLIPVKVKPKSKKRILWGILFYNDQHP